MLRKLTIVLLLSTVTFTTIPANAQEEPQVVDDKVSNCINLRSIRRTEVIDDRNILFHFSHSRVYHNILSSGCRGLGREKRFSYSTTIGSLCEGDTISVLEDSSFGLESRGACRLGQFYKMTREDAKALKQSSNLPPRSNPLPMPEPEEVGGGDEEKEET